MRSFCPYLKGIRWLHRLIKTARLFERNLSKLGRLLNAPNFFSLVAFSFVNNITFLIVFLHQLPSVWKTDNSLMSVTQTCRLSPTVSLEAILSLSVFPYNIDIVLIAYLCRRTCCDHWRLPNLQWTLQILKNSKTSPEILGRKDKERESEIQCRSFLFFSSASKNIETNQNLPFKLILYATTGNIS